MNEKQLVKLGKFLSLVLRHSPETIGITLDEQGWTRVDLLLKQMNKHKKTINQKMLEEIVATNNKKRYAFNADKTLIRANQGHSVKIDLGYQPKTPPAILYHGTASRFTDSIFKEGIQKQNRHHVHLSADIETALKVGGRHGKPVVLAIRTAEMIAAGFQFFQSENGVWLVEEVPTQYFHTVENRSTTGN